MTAWNSWDTVHEAAGKDVLIKYEMPDGSIHINNDTITESGEGPYYALFDCDVLVEPSAWMYIPD